MKIFNFSKFSERTILMKMNQPGWFSAEGKKQISQRGSGWGVTSLEKLRKEKKNLPWEVRGSNGPRKERKTSENGVRGSRKSAEPLAEERNAKAGKGLGVKSRVGPLIGELSELWISTSSSSEFPAPQALNPTPQVRCPATPASL